MEEKFNLGKLFSELAERSYFTNPTKEEIKDEWVFVCTEKLEEPESCLCGHYPIINSCVMRNKHNDSIISVGNVCVNKFFEQDFSYIFTDIAKLEKDITSSVTDKTRDYCLEKKFINDWEYHFLANRKGKKKASFKQIQKKTDINNKILKSLKTKR